MHKTTYVSTLQKIDFIKGISRNFHFMEEIETFWISFSKSKIVENYKVNNIGWRCIKIFYKCKWGTVRKIFSSIH